jgi:hypothetical protein
MKKFILLILFSCITLFSCKSKYTVKDLTVIDTALKISDLEKGQKIIVDDLEIVPVKIGDSIRIKIIKSGITPRKQRVINRVNKLRAKAELTETKLNNKKKLNNARTESKQEKISKENMGFKMPFKVKVSLTILGFLLILIFGISIAAWMKRKLT